MSEKIGLRMFIFILSFLSWSGMLSDRCFGEETQNATEKGTGKISVLFLCTGNSCRSQMAEGWTRHLKGDVIEAYSAGIETHGLNPNAVAVMKESGVDISQQKSKNIADFKDIPIDYVVTVCTHAAETCPVFPSGCKVVHYGFQDPPKMAREVAARGGSAEEQLNCYRSVRDEIKKFVQSLPESLEKLTETSVKQPR